MSWNIYVSVVAEELGLVALWQSPLDTKLLCLQRFVRLFAYGGSTLVLTLYLSALGISDERIGLFMTLTLWGDVIISFILTLFADGLGRKAVLAVGSMMMTGSGVVFAFSGNYWVLLAAAVFGVISPSGNEIGPFRALEESTLAHLTPKEVRTDVFAWYALIGTGGGALGLLSGGWMVSFLKAREGWSDMQAYRVVFVAYAFAGVLKLVLSLLLSKDVEADPEDGKRGDSEAAIRLQNSSSGVSQDKMGRKSLIPKISAKSRSIVIQLCLLFAVDSFASGLASLSWFVPFFRRKFDIDEGTLGTLFFTSNIIAAFSSLVAASLARRIGNINTMVFTHLPSAIFLTLIALPPQFFLAAMFLFLRSCTQSMDGAPRSAFLSAVVLPNERTAVMGVINLVKTFSQSLGPGITGLLFQKDLAWVAFVTAGTLKAVYDLSLLAVFRAHVSHGDEVVSDAEARRSREESNRGLLAEDEEDD